MDYGRRPTSALRALDLKNKRTAPEKQNNRDVYRPNNFYWHGDYTVDSDF